EIQFLAVLGALRIAPSIAALLVPRRMPCHAGSLLMRACQCAGEVSRCVCLCAKVGAHRACPCRGMLEPRAWPSPILVPRRSLHCASVLLPRAALCQPR
ncbi:hypothetical protein HAX54_034316, partial [Datura stramonium]|nr:hypothetical protein [Datura stramonium]